MYLTTLPFGNETLLWKKIFLERREGWQADQAIDAPLAGSIGRQNVPVMF